MQKLAVGRRRFIAAAGLAVVGFSATGHAKEAEVAKLEAALGIDDLAKCTP